MTGGFRLGAKWAGLKFDKEYHSDIDEYANKVYVKHFPESIQLGDITGIDFESLKDGSEWIITGGFPCQDISIAGKGAGIEGKRSGLWSEMSRAIRILRPRFAIIENVSALTFRGFDRVLSDLAEIGYDAEWQNIRASFVGLPQNRNRLWIIAYPCKFGLESQDKEKELISKVLPKWTSRQVDLSGPIKRIIYECDCECLPGSDGFPFDVDEIRCLGNSIVPQIAELLFNQIKDYLSI